MKKILLELELTNRCNARCVMCPVAGMKRERGFMTRETFELNVEKGIDYGIQGIRFCGLGEPLLHRDFCRFLAYAKGRNLTAELTTNGSLLREEVVQCLIENKIDFLSISFPSLIKENYERMMKGLVFERVLENVLSAIRELKKVSPARIKVSSAITAINHDEKAHIKDFWSREGVDYVEIHTVHNRGGHLKDMGMLDLSSGSEDVADPGKKRSLSLCPWPLRQFFVGWNGSVLLCCCDVEGEYRVGDVYVDDFGDMERSQESISIMQPDLCKRCSYQKARVIST